MFRALLQIFLRELCSSDLHFVVYIWELHVAGSWVELLLFLNKTYDPHLSMSFLIKIYVDKIPSPPE